MNSDMLIRITRYYRALNRLRAIGLEKVFAHNLADAAGVSAAVFHIVNNAPGTASPIPGLLAPFAFNPPLQVILALAFAIAGGSLAGFVGSLVFRRHKKRALVLCSS